MSALALQDAPPPGRPLRWLLSSPLWGMAAGLWLALQGGALLAGRWSPSTVAFVHMFTLGVLGNAMLGSLLQFLPVAAGSALPLRRSSAWLHAAFNLGLALFVAALAGAHRGLLLPSAALLALPLFAFPLAALPGLLARGGAAMLRAGIGASLCALVATATLGVLLVLVLRGEVSLPLARIVDMHAMIGLLGWVLVLMASVGSVTLPMFQGTMRIGQGWLGAWLALAGACLSAGMALRLTLASPLWGLAVASVPVLAWVVASLWLSLGAPHPRNGALAGFWRSGSLALGLACLVALAAAALALPAWTGMLAGVLAIGIGFPLLLGGMLLEIVGFLAWIGLRRTCPRGVRVPGVGRLLPERDKRIALAASLSAAAMLAAATAWPVLARPAGLALLLAHAACLACALACRMRARRFLRGIADSAA